MKLNETSKFIAMILRHKSVTIGRTRQQMAGLFESSRTNIVEHILHIYKEGEFDEDSICRNFRQVRTEGGRQVIREIPYYNLDMIISLILNPRRNGSL